MSSSSAAGIIDQRDRWIRSKSRLWASMAGSGLSPSRARSWPQSRRLVESSSVVSRSRTPARSTVSASPALAAWSGVRPRRDGCGVWGQISPMTYALCSRVSRSTSFSGMPAGTLHRQLIASRCRDTLSRSLVRGWAGGMFARRGREPIAEPIEPAIIVGLEYDRVPADDHLAFDHRNISSREPRPRRDPGPVEQVEPLGRRGIRVVGMDGTVGSWIECGVGPEGLQQSVPVADRPAQVDELDGIGDRGRPDPLAKGLEVDRLDGRPAPRDEAAQGRDGGGVVGDPEAADAPIPFGDRAGGRGGGQQLERRGRRRPEALLGPADGPFERLAERLGHPLRRRPEVIRVLFPDGQPRTGP